MQISVAQALLILIDKYKKNADQFDELKKLYLSGAKDQKSLELIEHYLKDDALVEFKVARDPRTINNDDSRRYFETQVAYKTLENNLSKLSLEKFQNYLDAVELLKGAYYKNAWEHVLKYHLLTGNKTEKAYSNYLRQLDNKEIFGEFSDENRAKISAMVASSFVAITLSEIPAFLPLDIFGEGSYKERGKVFKLGQESTHTKAYGLLKGHSPLPIDDLAAMKHTQPFKKPSDGSDYNLNTKWVQDNFAKLVHPFSNSISGTILSQLRVLLKVRANMKEDPLADQMAIALLSENIKTYLKTFISAMLFNSGAHTLYEFTSVLGLEKVQNAFADVDGFSDFNLEELFLTSNQEAFNSALAQTIQYNNKLLNRGQVHQQIKEKKATLDIPQLNTAIIKSSLNEDIKFDFIKLMKLDLNKASTCFRIAQDLHHFVMDNKARLGSEYFASYRTGLTRHQMIEQNINEAIACLSQGDDEQARVLIEDTKEILNIHKSLSLFKPNIPELDKLNKIIRTIDNYVDTSPCMKLNAKIG